MWSTWENVAILLLSVLSNCRANPEVTITQGTVQGTNLISNHGRNISAFLGIPYAQPPVGALRFRNPLPAGNWSGIYNATADASFCPQISNSVLIGDEDCLYLNVYSPQLPDRSTESLLPVMVWVHGGAFEMGSSHSRMYGPEYLLDRDIVQVSMNYRLGLLGFFTTGDSLVPGNFGLKDQVLALRWVQENIRFFGGDPEKVTVFGNSAGGSSVHYLSLSDSTEGLFHRYILQSGCANGLWAYQERSTYTANAIALGERFGCPTSTITVLVECLRELDLSTILNSTSSESPMQLSSWLPTDEEPGSNGAFLTDNPRNLIAQGKIRDVPWIVGNTREEGLLFTGSFYFNPALFEVVLNNLDSVLPSLLGYDNATITAAIKSYFFHDLDGDRSELLNNLTDVVGDFAFVFPAVDLLDKHLAHASQPAYFYSFDYRGAMSYSYRYAGNNNTDIGVAHADECIYLFPQGDSVFGTLDANMSETDMIMMEQIVELWVSFATTGVPTISSLNNTSFWEPYALNKKHLQIGNNSDATLYLQSKFLEERMQFWRELAGSSSANTFTTISIFLSLVTCLIVRVF